MEDLVVGEKPRGINEEQEITLLLLDADYKRIRNQGGEQIAQIRLYGRDHTGKLIIIRVEDFRPYFYVTEEAKLDSFISKSVRIRDWLVEASKSLEKSLYMGGEKVKVRKLVGRRPWEVPTVRNLFKSAAFDVHEADIPFSHRFLIDNRLRCLSVITVIGRVTESSFDKTVLQVKSKDISSNTAINPMEFWKPIIASLDIEIDETGATLADIIQEKKKRITAISMAWGVSDSPLPDSEVFVLKKDTDEAEVELLHSFLAMLEKIQLDIIVTFNGDQFDFPYLFGRMEKLGVSPTLLSPNLDTPFNSDRLRTYKIPGRTNVDLFPKSWGVHPISGKKGLHEVSITLLGEGKTKISTSLGELWKKGMQGGDTESKAKFIEYSNQDSLLTYKLFFALGIDGWIEVLRVVGYPLQEGIVTTARNAGEHELMRILFENQILIPALPTKKELEARTKEKRSDPHAGGYIFGPKGSIHESVLIADFRSMYPSLMYAYNLGGESFRGKGVSAGKMREATTIEEITDLFNRDLMSSLGKMQNKILNQRKTVKEKISRLKKDGTKKDIISNLEHQSSGLKVVGNSVYGSHVYTRGRFFSGPLSNAITSLGRLHILQLDKWIDEFSSRNDQFCSMVYGDTDSAFVAFGKDVTSEDLSDIIKELLDFINSKLPEEMELELEDIASRIIFKPGRAKAYSYLSAISNDVIVKGFEAVRSDWSEVAREAQRKVLNNILRTEDLEIGHQKARDELLSYCVGIMKSPKLRDLIILGSIRRPPSQYKAQTPTIGAFLHYCKEKVMNPEEEWSNFDKFPYVISNDSMGPLYRRARHPTLFRKLDKEHYIIQAISASERFSVNITIEEVRREAGIVSLDRFLQPK